MKAKYIYLGDGCATGWDECPNDDPITVVRADKPTSLTECRQRGTVELVAYKEAE